MTQPRRRHLWPNVGGEEPSPERFASIPQVAATRRLWGGLFDRHTTPLPDDPAPDWAEAAAAHDAPALAPIAETDGLVPWLVTPEAERAAERAGVALLGPPAAVVRRVHDKAFAIEHARSEGYEPRALRHAITILSAEEVRAMGEAGTDPMPRAPDAADAWAHLGDAVRPLFKPRIGTSGRGRFEALPDPGEAGPRRARLIQRAADAGGLILEPNLDRVTDLSVVLWLSRPDRGAGEPPVTVLAALRQLVTRSGTWRGHRGEIDRRGRLYSGTPDDDAMREAAASVAGAALAEGFHGPCGIDGFTFRLPDRPGEAVLRPVIELNARFTMGHVTAGWMRRLLPWLVESRGLEPGRRIGFVLALAPPPGARGWADVARDLDADVLPLPFATAAATARPLVPIDPAGQAADADASGPAAEARGGPAIVLHDDPARLDALADRIAATPPRPGRSGGD